MTDQLLPQVRSLKAEGKGDDAIARALGVTRHTVRKVLSELERGQALPVAQGDLFTLPAEPLAPKEYASRILACWRQSVEAILMVGKLLGHAKANLDHGDFLKMVDEELPFGARTAQRLMAIAEDGRLANTTHVSHLPPAWGTLYELTKLDDDTFNARIADGTINPAMERKDIATAVKQQTRAVRERVLAGIQHALPQRKFGVILADPEWRFEPWSRATGMDRAADNHYPTSCLEVIKARDVPSIAADDCVLFLWATVPMLPHALAVMAAWGFDYRSHVVWDKMYSGTGYWFTNRHELLLVGVRGNIPAPGPGQQFVSLQIAQRNGHSAKPEWSYELIEQYFPNLPKIELNRRGPPRPGWAAWGNETESEAPVASVASDQGAPAGPLQAGAPASLSA